MYAALPKPDAYLAAPRKRIALIGMSGVGKTRIAKLLRDSGDWFHYSVDYRIGTRYLGEKIVDNFKREAMKNPFLRDLLRSDSVYIGSNLSFHNLAPLSTYLGKPGDPAKGGVPFEDYLARQREHRQAEISAMADSAHFTRRAESLYGYPSFVCDTSGSICEIVNPDDPADPVLTGLTEIALPVLLRGTEEHREQLARRFDAAPKPMYYNEEFLREKWTEYLAAKGCAPDEVDPDAFIRWGYRELLSHRAPLYDAIAQNWGVSLPADAVAHVASADEFNALIADSLERKRQNAKA